MSTGLVHPSGIDLDDIFEVTGTGTQQTNILCYDSQDIGARYRAGTTNISDTGFRIASGVDVKNLFGGKGVGLFRPSGAAWEAGASCTSWNEDQNVDFWTDYIERWTNRPRDAICVSGVMNDCISASINSDAGRTSVVWAYTPFRTGTLSLEYQVLGRGNNDGDVIQIWDFEIDAYCKGVIMQGATGSGDWALAVVRIKTVISGYGTYEYEGLYRSDTDSNHAWPGSAGSGSINWNGKLYQHYNP